MADGVNVGDAVLTFFADTTQLDLAFDKTDQTETRLEPANTALKELGGNWQFAGNTASTAGEKAIVAGEEMEEGAERGAKALREARGEAGLLGEAFGVHLPRHVRSFVAELPGVGEALSAAFSATAILFIIQAVIELTNKITEFVSSHFIFTEEMKASTAAIIANNVELLKQAEAYDKAKEAVDAFGKDGVEKAAESVDKLSKSIVDNQAEIRSIQDQLFGQRNGDIFLTEKQIGDFQNKLNLLNATVKAQQEQLSASQIAYAESIHRSQLEELSAQEKVALAYAQTEQETFEIKQNYGAKRLALLKQVGNEEISQQRTVSTQLEIDLIQHEQKVSAAFVALLQSVQHAREQSLEQVKDSTVANEIALTPLEKQFLKAQDAAHEMGITLRTDLVTALEGVKKAYQDFLGSGIVDPVALKSFQKAIADDQKALDNFGKDMDKFKIHSHGLWSEFVRDQKAGATAMDETKRLGVNAFDSLSRGVESAFASAILGQKSFGKALEEGTATALAQIASQALVKALFYTGEGFAALASLNYGGAASFFEAAGIMGAVGAAAGVAGHALAGAANGGGSSQGASQTNSSVSNTSGQAGGRPGAVTVQKFADGGLVSAPTLAILGEDTAKSGPEVVAGLNDRETWQKIAKAIVPHVAGGRGSGPTVHVHGLISPDNLTKVMKQMDRRIRKGQANLTSSNTFRITRRSA